MRTLKYCDPYYRDHKMVLIICEPYIYTYTCKHMGSHDESSMSWSGPHISRSHESTTRIRPDRHSIPRDEGLEFKV